MLCNQVLMEEKVLREEQCVTPYLECAFRLILIDVLKLIWVI